MLDNLLMKAYPIVSSDEANTNMTKLGTLKVNSLISAKHKTIKYILMDQLNHLINVEHKNISDVSLMMTQQVNQLIERGMCTITMHDDLIKILKTKAATIDPTMRLHKAVTLEVLNDVDSSELPAEINTAVDTCGGKATVANENLMTSSVEVKHIYRTIGGALCTTCMTELSGILDKSYLDARNK